MQIEKWALITGASGGIGTAIAVELARSGFHLYLHYHRNEAAIQKVQAACSEYGGAAMVIQGNLESIEDIERIRMQLPRMPDVLVNNAGMTHYGLFTETGHEDLERLYQINIRAPFLLAQICAPSMIRQRCGRIVNISSIWGVTGASCEVLYSMTKGALISFTKALAKELAPSGVTVNAVVPGAVEGELMDRQFTKNDQAEIALEIPMGRFAKPVEIASLVSYLLRSEAEYITGQVISPNGGWYT